jgi:hypothetical protein
MRRQHLTILGILIGCGAGGIIGLCTGCALTRPNRELDRHIDSQMGVICYTYLDGRALSCIPVRDLILPDYYLDGYDGYDEDGEDSDSDCENDACPRTL